MQEQETTADPYGMTTRKAKQRLWADRFALRASLEPSAERKALFEAAICGTAEAVPLNKAYRALRDCPLMR